VEAIKQDAVLSQGEPRDAAISLCSRCTRRPMLGSSPSRGLTLFSREIIFKNSNGCEKHTATSQTDRRTEHTMA